MNILILKKFNNYFNRIIIKLDTLQEYKDAGASWTSFYNINFNPNEGLTTELIVGSEGQKIDGALIDWEKSGSPDYLVTFDDNNAIVSRWFIMECQRTRSGQYRLSLKRDIIAENKEAVEDATCFVEKGYVEREDDPAIYNLEPIETNQIKSDEFLLKDETQCPWIVGYVAKDREDINNPGTLTPVTWREQEITGPNAADSACHEIFANFDEFWEAHPELVGDLATVNNWTATVNLDVRYWDWLFDAGSEPDEGLACTYNSSDGSFTCLNNEFQHKAYLYDSSGTSWWGWDGVDNRQTAMKSMLKNWTEDSFESSFLAKVAALENVQFISKEKYQKFEEYVSKGYTVKIGSKYYTVSDKYGGDNNNSSTKTEDKFISKDSDLAKLLYNNMNLTPYLFTNSVNQDKYGNIKGNPGNETFSISCSYDKHAVQFSECFAKCKAKVPNTVPLLKDAPYHMFAIPYSDDLALYNGNTLHCKTYKSVAMNAAQKLAQQTGVGVIYDVQLLPYCPIRDIIKTTKHEGGPTIAPATLTTVNQYYKTEPKERAVETIKPYHQYGIRKDIFQNIDYAGNGDCRCFGIASNSDIIVKYNDQTYNCKRIEITLADVTDITSQKKIILYNKPQLIGSYQVVAEFDYNTYASSALRMIIETTDYIYRCGVSNESMLDDDIVIWSFESLAPNTRETALNNTTTWQEVTTPPLTIRAISFDDLLVDYIVEDDYYTSKIDISKAITSNIVTVINGVEADVVSTIFWCTESKFTFNKFLDDYYLLQADGSYKADKVSPIIDKYVKQGENIEEIKVRNQVNTLRLASPNYSNFFDINIQRNNGIEYVNVDCTYKPYQPYIHVNPNFKGLYGADYDDVRGLICGGDYSIATTSDAWANYQLQNKNYQAVFDREMQKLETSHEIQKQIDIANAVAGTGTGAVGGALAGSKLGGLGAVIGAVGGAALSGIGGMMDVTNSQRLREMQISTMKDVHKYQLGNIKALPIGLSKTSYLTNNNKLFPFLEFYTCTPTEEQAVRDSLTYEGMTINRLGRIADFQGSSLPYIRAKLIRLYTVEDAHQVHEIARELETGVYIPKGE